MKNIKLMVLMVYIQTLVKKVKLIKNVREKLDFKPVANIDEALKIIFE